ncbi:flagellar brake protein [Oceanobacillus halotolerans]|uniref:flagellar brake protein n=1 Tax=Oceanobacillus halotolerans TaxID=2663380 RepID=UPI0013D9BA7E|nr:flagellar brake domain-containing protein [Oceanobacillus halotolerans]
MKIGQPCNLEIKDTYSGEMEKYYCKVIDKNKDFIFIDYPIHSKTKRSKKFPVGSVINVSYVGSDNSVYTFTSEITKQVESDIPALAFDKPQKKDISRIQRRRYVRVETAVDVAVQLKSSETPAFTTVTNDISGGGASIVLPKGTTLKGDEFIELHLVLPMVSGEYYYIDTEAKIIRINHNEGSIDTASLSFDNIQQQDQQYIIRYCFEKQREARKKERQ